MSWSSILLGVVVFVISYWFFNRPKSYEDIGEPEEQLLLEDIDNEDVLSTNEIDYTPVYLTIDYLIGKEITIKWMDSKTYLTNELEATLLELIPDDYVKVKCLESHQKHTISYEDLTHDGLRFNGRDIEFVDDTFEIIPEHEEKITKSMLTHFLNEEVCFNYSNYKGEDRFHTIKVSDIDTEVGAISGYFLKNGKPENTKYTFMAENIHHGVFMLYIQSLYEFVDNDEIHLYD